MLSVDFDVPNILSGHEHTSSVTAAPIAEAVRELAITAPDFHKIGQNFLRRGCHRNIRTWRLGGGLRWIGRHDGLLGIRAPCEREAQEQKEREALQKSRVAHFRDILACTSSLFPSPASTIQASPSCHTVTAPRITTGLPNVSAGRLQVWWAKVLESVALSEARSPRSVQ